MLRVCGVRPQHLATITPQAKAKAKAEAEAKAKAEVEAKAKAEAEAQAKAEAALARRVEVLGLLQPMRDAGLASDAAVLHKAVRWCDDNGATALEDITSTGMAADFVRSLGLKPIPAKKLTAALQPLQSLASQLSHRPPAAGGGDGSGDGGWLSGLMGVLSGGGAWGGRPQRRPEWDPHRPAFYFLPAATVLGYQHSKLPIMQARATSYFHSLYFTLAAHGTSYFRSPLFTLPPRGTPCCSPAWRASAHRRSCGMRTSLCDCLSTSPTPFSGRA